MVIVRTEISPTLRSHTKSVFSAHGNAQTTLLTIGVNRTHGLSQRVAMTLSARRRIAVEEPVFEWRHLIVL